MTDRRKKEILTSGIVVLAVILVYSFRLVGRGDFYHALFSYLRIFRRHLRGNYRQKF